MMHPMRVEWTVPDHTKIEAAEKMPRADAIRINGPFVDADLELLKVALIRVRTDAERDEIWCRRYPDLAATLTYYGTLLSVRHVPAQRGVTFDPQTRRTAIHEISSDRWVALVATADGTREMDPMKFRVLWPMSPGDPIGGIVDLDQRARDDAAQREYVSSFAKR